MTRDDSTAVCDCMTDLSEIGIGTGAWNESYHRRAPCHACLGNQTHAPAHAFVPQ